MYEFIFNKKLGMLFKNRKRISTRHFLALQINTKQLLKYLTIFQNFGILILKHDRCGITVILRTHLRSHFACIAPKFGADTVATSVGKWEFY